MPLLLAVDSAPDPATGPSPAPSGWAILLLVAGAVLIALWVLRRLVEREQDRAD